MSQYLINPIDLMPFIGVPQNKAGQTKKLVQLYQADAQKLLDNGDVAGYNLILEKIKEIQAESNNK